MMKKEKNIVCLGGGIGTSNLLRGIKNESYNLTIITSMADDGGSSGRLRKAYDIMPPGDIVNCIAALIPDGQEDLAELLLYRYAGDKTQDFAIDGQKLGNLIMLAEIQRTGDFHKAVAATKKLFGVDAVMLPATDERVELHALTPDGRHVHSETTLDLALYSEPHGLKKVFIEPERPTVNKKVVQSLLKADTIISGPGDLYTNQLPVLIVPTLKEAFLNSKAKKIFVLNIANKPFETRDFTLEDFIRAFEDHLGIFPFDTIIANDNLSFPIPSKYDYSYISLDYDKNRKISPFTLLTEDLINDTFPLYHDANKLAEILKKHI